jgi:hypothetical protein
MPRVEDKIIGCPRECVGAGGKGDRACEGEVESRSSGEMYMRVYSGGNGG